MNFGNRLRTLREKRGWTLEELAERADISAPYVCMLEMGVRSPSFDTLKALAGALGMKLDRLMEGV